MEPFLPLLQFICNGLTSIFLSVQSLSNRIDSGYPDSPEVKTPMGEVMAEMTSLFEAVDLMKPIIEELARHEGELLDQVTVNNITDPIMLIIYGADPLFKKLEILENALQPGDSEGRQVIKNISDVLTQTSETVTKVLKMLNEMDALIN
ncbi:uncharacterized protein LOC110855634 [Folsomia candida]|uniref:uncharacterized protein LOC110855634 n=1 Tax=Folsomia candida TaxID=158441 RepID=UPI000B8FFA8F|nr:uncharacterized protein LOC110855634 [Folsomia candida]